MKFFNYHVIALLSIFFTQCATPYQVGQEWLNKGLTVVRENHAPLVCAAISAATATYIGYAMYLDGLVNNKDSLWHWSIHAIKDGIINQDILISHVEERYPELKSLHPLTAIFATAHEAQVEIDLCLGLRSILKNLHSVHLTWIMSESIASLDKKLESLYILKIMLANCTLETRSRCKKRAQL
jgi:hypothetical protein